MLHQKKSHSRSSGATLKYTHPQQIAPVRLQGGVRLQGQGVRNSMNSVRDERGRDAFTGGCGRKKTASLVFGQMSQEAQ